MLIVSEVEEDIRVLPKDLSKSPIEAATEVIQRTCVDKVVPDLGLIVSLYDVLNIEGGFIYPNDGAAWFRVKFRVVVFRPFEGETIVGDLRSCDKNGLKLSLGFFDDVIIPEHSLQDPSFFDDSEKLWVWKFDGNDMYMELNDPVRFRVRSVRFNQKPTPLQLQNGDDALLGTVAKPFAPMEVIGDINGDGLGMLSWWAPQ